MTEQSATEPDSAVTETEYSLGKWTCKTGLALTIWRDRKDNLGTLFVNEQKFGVKNQIPNQELAQHIVTLLTPFMERKLIKQYDCADGLEHAKLIADGTVQTTAEDGGPEAYDDEKAEGEYTVSVWAANNGPALTLWSNRTLDLGTYFLHDRKFSKAVITTEKQLASLLLKYVKQEVLDELKKDWVNEIGLEQLEVWASGERPKYLRMKLNDPGQHMSHLYQTLPVQKAVAAEMATAELLHSAQKRGILFALNSVIPFPMFAEFGSLDHIAVMHHSVFLINTVFSSRRINPSAQRKSMDQYGALAPHLEKLLNEKMKPERHIFVRVALSIWSPAPFTPFSPYSIAGADLIKTLQALDGQYVKTPIDSKAVVKVLADSDTWSGPIVHKELQELNDDQEQDA